MATHSRVAGPHRVVLAAYDDAEILDVAGPASVFRAASQLRRTGARPYDVVVAHVGGAGRDVVCSGVALQAERALDDVRGRIDTLIVPGSFAVASAPVSAPIVDSVRRAARRSTRVASVCTGSFVLGAAGLLDGKRVATHWAGCALLRARHPACRVEDDAIFVRDGALWTSAGVTAGIDLALAMVEEDHDRELALRVARWLVVYLQRPGGQSQFSVPLAAQTAETEPIRDVVAYVREHPSGDLRVPALARRAGMSERNFARVFRRELGESPAEHVEAARVEAARRALETTAKPVKRIAADCGFGTAETLHRVFRRALRVTPGDYRARFQLRRQRPSRTAT
jgi:transcriptional regulator GlxA family with amidase domain